MRVLGREADNQVEVRLVRLTYSILTLGLLALPPIENPEDTNIGSLQGQQVNPISQYKGQGVPNSCHKAQGAYRPVGDADVIMSEVFDCMRLAVVRLQAGV